MLETFTPEQQRLIEGKVRELQEIRNRNLTAAEVAASITQRRLEWLEEKRHLLRDDLPLPEAAYRLLIEDHMGVEEGISLIMTGENMLKVEARNFCPYLEACRRLEMDTRVVCKEIGEPSLVEFFRAIGNLHFRRDYDHIRPYTDFCIEFLEERK